MGSEDQIRGQTPIMRARLGLDQAVRRLADAADVVRVMLGELAEE